MTAGLEDWHTRAACLGRAPLWDATVDDDNSEDPKDRLYRLDVAKKVCERECTVQSECMADALPGRDEGMRVGVLLPPIGKPKSAPREHRPGSRLGWYSEAPHGTPGAIGAHYRRGEKTCEACAVKRREIGAANRAKKKAAS